MSLREDIESIREDIKLYTKLSGEDGSQETIATIGAYLRGYRQGKEDAEPHWIPVDLENNEPPLEEWVLVSSDGYVMQDCIVERGGEKIWYHGGNIRAEDRYMPLPKPYKGVTE